MITGGWLDGIYRVYVPIVLVLRYLRRERDTLVNLNYTQ